MENNENNKGTIAQQITDKVEYQEQLSKDIEKLHTELYNLRGSYMYKETKEEFLILDKLYHNFLKAKRKLLNIGAIELSNKSDIKEDF